MMACGAVFTGQHFLSATLAHVDCQARTIGAYGFDALADGRSPVAAGLTGLLMIFVMLFGLRMMFGTRISANDLLGSVIKIGIVLTLATSWPAWRTVGYNLVMDGPAEVTGAIRGAASLPGSRDMVAQLQRADDGIVALTVLGSGRATASSPDPDLGDAPRGVALTDQYALGTARAVFLAVTISSFALVHLGAGILLALAPLMAGLLLFGQTVGLFVGWLRGLFFCALGALLLNLAQAAHLALLDPWMTDVLARRAVATYTPAAPTELLVLVLAFAGLIVGLLFLAARLSFHVHPASLLSLFERGSDATSGGEARSRPERDMLPQIVEPPSRAFVISQAVAGTLRREERDGNLARQHLAVTIDGRFQPLASGHGAGRVPATTGSSSSRRGSRRVSAAVERRDRTR